jgi:hypothetical protein
LYQLLARVQTECRKIIDTVSVFIVGRKTLAKVGIDLPTSTYGLMASAAMNGCATLFAEIAKKLLTILKISA